ncbi:unnamed protein product [Pieris macdunnoughi]|uniref:Uncharacterized protein n=1 Tax=Pieris macdunnoughi TaxID=345717 RepID=A0A821N8N7_9NEOP|nr:unnamed protein product [Pieris macdunnoughi]
MVVRYHKVREVVILKGTKHTPVRSQDGNSRTYAVTQPKQDPPPNKKFHGHYFETRAHLNRERHLCLYIICSFATHGVRGECPYSPPSSSSIAPSRSSARESLFF